MTTEEHHHAEGQQGRADVSGDQARGRKQGKSRSHRAIKNWFGARYGEAPEALPRQTQVIDPDKVAQVLKGEGSIDLRHLQPEVANALVETAWNLPLAARRLNLSLEQLDDALQQTKALPRLLQHLKKLPKAAPEYRKLSLAQVEEDILRRAVLYRAGALEALYELARMPLSDQSGLMQVKLAAAAKLYNETGDKSVGSEIDVTLRALNDEYHKAAPRIKEIRERTITFEHESQPKLVSDQ